MTEFDPNSISYVCTCFDPEAPDCPLHSTHERVQKLVDRPDPVFEPQGHWQEVTSCDGKEICICHTGELPTIYVVRGSQMFKLLWPEMPQVDKTKTSMR